MSFKRYLIFIVMIIVCVSMILPTTALAESKEDLEKRMDKYGLNDISPYLMPDACAPNSSGNDNGSAPSGNLTYIKAGNIPEEGIEVGATIYGGEYHGKDKKWYSTNKNQGSAIGNTGDDTGIGNHDNILQGSTTFAELGNGKALGKLKNGQKIHIEYKGKSLVAEKGDIGGGGDDIKGKSRAVDLWWEVAAMLDFKSGSDVIKIHAVDDSTPLTPNTTKFDKSSHTLTSITNGSETEASQPSTNEDVCCVSTGSDTGNNISLEGNDNAEKVYNFFTSKGLSSEQAAAIVGNGMQESNLKPNASSGSFRGIFQWSVSDRWRKLEKWVKSHGMNSNSLEGQLGYAWQEATDMGVIEKIKTYDDVEHAAWYWGRFFEIAIVGGSSSKTPMTNVQELDKRIQYGKAALKKYGGNSSGSSGDSSGASCSTGASGDTSSLSSTIKSYAWPEYHAPNYFKKMPAYEAAIKKVQGKKYVGGGPAHPGIDCGGFVTRALQDSGFEKDYNTDALGGFGGPTEAQRAWLDKHWQKLGNVSSSKDLKPGDVAIKPGHTWLWVGEIEGFGSKGASASYSEKGISWRTPMAAKEASQIGQYTWYRKK